MNLVLGGTHWGKPHRLGIGGRGVQRHGRYPVVRAESLVVAERFGDVHLAVHHGVTGAFCLLRNGHIARHPPSATERPILPVRGRF